MFPGGATELQPLSFNQNSLVFSCLKTMVSESTVMFWDKTNKLLVLKSRLESNCFKRM